ncbi:hypothetical protein IV494_06080 [Kaistella sp. G5-32]|uniref:Uncharacterized protein n=1 Tax=Kaistella gelatinilytica TaxID=2787636 RepID=A0ABS0FAK5_9FLAO|nr:hypothetical protein [Kaistella gelatinilytica]MBF8456747.1 hypothetical protein [Kaistella gelatinilytica]
MKITQKKLFKTQVLDFDDSKLHITTSKLGNKNEFDISFESIFTEKYHIKESSLILFFSAAFFYLLSFALYYWRFIQHDKNIEEEAFVFWAIVATILLALGILFLQNFWKINLAGGSFLKIYKNSPAKSEVDHFIEELFNRRNEYLKKMYGHINPNLDYENQHNNFRWLLNMKVFSTLEFEEKVRSLDEIFNKNSTKIGF